MADNDVDDDSLDFVLQDYHDRQRSREVPDSVLETLTKEHGEMPPVLLWGPGSEGDGPMVRPETGEEMQALHRRYEIHGELARGGIGVVYKGRDADLGRDIAIKTLRDRHVSNREMVHRFVEEAQIGGQLQHPGILPVYELGMREDHRPYFTMKLVKGQTLAALLAERKHPGDDLRRFLSIVEQVCQTMAYAHSRNVIHRDLKPANIMVGSFGEVQVMDWGLAKVLAAGGVADERKAKREARETMIETVRNESNGSQSVTGSVMGTLAYMPPEQARGEVEQLDQRSDVFSLGAILFEVLTGRAPYLGETVVEVREKAARADLQDAFACIEESDVDPELAQLVRACLTPARKSRPRDAGVVAEQIAGYLSSLEQRAREAELDAAEARIKAGEERRARRLTLALAVTALLVVVTGGGGYLWMDHAQQVRGAEATRVASQALEDAKVVFGEAKSQGFDLATLDKAQASAIYAHRLAGNEDVDPAVGERVARLLADIEAETKRARTAAEQAAKNATMVARLEAIQEEEEVDTENQRFDWLGRDREYAACFRDYGIDPSSHAKAVAAVRASGIAVELAAGLDEWSRAHRKAHKDGNWQRFLEIAHDADEDAFRRRVRGATLAHDVERLGTLATSTELESQPASTWILLGRALDEAGQLHVALTVLRKAQSRHPGNYDISYNLSRLLGRAKQYDEGVRFATGALASRPQAYFAWNNLGCALDLAGRRDEAIETFLAAIRIQPGFCLGHYNVGLLRMKQDKLAAAIHAFKQAIQLKPSYSKAHIALGHCLVKLCRWDEARTVLEKAIELKPDAARARFLLGMVLNKQGKLDETIEAYRAAIRLRPDYAEAHGNLGSALSRKGDGDGACAAYREAIRINPQLSMPQTNLPLLLLKLGRWDEAVAVYKKAIEIDGNNAECYLGLGVAYLQRGKMDEAGKHFEQAIKIKPDYAGAFNNLGYVYGKQGRVDESIDAYRQAIKHDPDFFDPLNNLGFALEKKGRVEEAVKWYREAIKRRPDHFEVHRSLGRALLQLGRTEEATPVLRRMTEIKPDDYRYHMFLSSVLLRQDRLDDAMEALQEARRLRPDDPRIHTQLGLIFFEQGRWQKALEAHRKALRLKPDLAEAMVNLGVVLAWREDLEGARKTYDKARRTKPGLWQAHYNLGETWQKLGRLEQAKKALEKAGTLRSDREIREKLAECVRMLALAPSLPTIVKDTPSKYEPRDRVILAKLCAARKLYLASARFWESVLSTDPENDDVARAAASAALAVSGAGEDTASLDATARTRWRLRAIGWLRTRLEQLTVLLGNGKAGSRFEVMKTLREWKQLPSLATLRDREHVGALPSEQSRVILAFWAEVDSLLARSLRRE